MSKIFVDTNLLVYSVDNASAAKRKKCRQILTELKDDKTGVISTQVIQEFYVAATKKLGVDPMLVKGVLHLLENFEVVTVDVGLIKEAIDCSVLYRLSFWDALIIVSAESAKCSKLWTEDLNNGQTIYGVTIENPLAL